MPSIPEQKLISYRIKIFNNLHKEKTEINNLFNVFMK